MIKHTPKVYLQVLCRSTLFGSCNVTVNVAKVPYRYEWTVTSVMFCIGSRTVGFFFCFVLFLFFFFLLFCFVLFVFCFVCGGGGGGVGAGLSGL